MPLIQATPKDEPEVVPNPVVEVKAPSTETVLPYVPTYRDNTQRSKDTDLNTLLQHVSGSPWSIDFYLNLNGSDQANVGFDPHPDEGSIFQQYHRIRDMEVRVTDPLTFEHDPATANTYYEGSANFYARVIPNEGNVFVADIGDGRRVLFEITTARPTSALKHTVYAITYRSKFEITPEITKVLESSTVKTSVFIRESLFGISRGLFSSEEHDIYLKAKTSLRRLHEAYGSKFYDERNNTLMLVEGMVYDSHVVEFFNTLPIDNVGSSRRYRELIIKHNGLNYGSLYTRIRGKHFDSSKMMVRFKLQAVRESYSPMVMGGIAVTEILDYVDRDKEAYIKPDKVDTPVTLPLYHPLPLDYYVLSGNYVEYNSPMSVLERELDNFHEGRVVDLRAITELASEVNLDTLTHAQYFYYVPIIIYLLCTVLREY